MYQLEKDSCNNSLIEVCTVSSSDLETHLQGPQSYFESGGAE